MPKAPAEPSTEAAQVKAVSTKSTTEDQCLILGPIDKQQAQLLSQRLVALGIANGTRDIPANGGVEFWVVLPPLDDNKAAVRKLQELQGRHIDGQIILQGDLTNAISLGLFGQRANAEKRLEEIRSQGYGTAVIREKPHAFKETWIMLQETEVPKLSEESWAAIHGDFPALSKRRHPCM